MYLDALEQLRDEDVLWEQCAESARPFSTRSRSNPRSPRRRGMSTKWRRSSTVEDDEAANASSGDGGGGGVMPNLLLLMRAKKKFGGALSPRRAAEADAKQQVSGVARAKSRRMTMRVPSVTRSASERSEDSSDASTSGTSRQSEPKCRRGALARAAS